VGHTVEPVPGQSDALRAKRGSVGICTAEGDPGNIASAVADAVAVSRDAHAVGQPVLAIAVTVGLHVE
jgi:hypothetical protein